MPHLREIDNTVQIVDDRDNVVQTFSPSLTGDAALPKFAVQPADLGFVSWTMQPGPTAGAASAVMVTLVPWLFKLPILEPVTLTNMYVYVSTLGATLTSGSCLGCIYDSKGNKLGHTGDQSSTWTTTGFKTMALTPESAGSLTIQGGQGVFVWACLLAAGTTMPVFQRWTQTVPGFVNGLLPASQALVGKLAAVTSGNPPPTTFNPSTDITLADTSHWVAVS